MKRQFNSISIGIVTGILIICITYLSGYMLDMNLNQITIVLFLIGGIMGITGLFYHYIYVNKYRSRIKKQIEFLNTRKPDLALADMQEMYEELKERGIKKLEWIVQLNMSAAYCDLKEYDKAFEMLKSIPEEKLQGIHVFIYKLNLCACYFYLGKFDECIETYKENESLFHAYSKNKQYGGNAAVVKLFALFAGGKYGEVKELLKETEEKWKDPGLEEDYRMLENRLKTIMAEK